MAKTKKDSSKEEPIEKQLWKVADKLRKNIDAVEYKHIVLGLIFLKYISDAFEELYIKLKKGEGDYVLTPGRYVGMPDDEDDFDFNERFNKLKVEFEGQLKEESRLNVLIAENLKKVKLV